MAEDVPRKSVVGSNEIERRLQARVHLPHYVWRNSPNLSNDGLVPHRIQVLARRRRVDQQPGLPSDRRGCLNQELRWLRTGEARSGRDLNNDRMIKTGVVPIA